MQQNKSIEIYSINCIDTHALNKIERWFKYLSQLRRNLAIFLFCWGAEGHCFALILFVAILHSGILNIC